MEVRDLYELLGRTYAQLQDETEIASHWHMQYEEMSKTVNILLKENEDLKRGLKNCENYMGRNDGDPYKAGENI